MTINDNYQIQILDNKINTKFWKENEYQKDLILQNLDIHHFCNMINNYFHKIKIVKNAKYNKLIVYEYKIVLSRNNEIRIAYCVDTNKKNIYILGMINLYKGFVKHKFDNLISSYYRG